MRVSLPLLSAGAVAAAASGAGPGPVPVPGAGPSAKRQPNFILILTDDQDQRLDSLSYQPKVKKHLVDEGTWFQKHFCTIALCCPSRVSFLTGRAAHNTNVTDVRPPFGGYTKFIAEGLNERYLPVWLQAAGYNTYYVGKLMNGHSTTTYDSPRAAGWNRSDFLLDPNTYLYRNASMVLDMDTPQLYTGNYSTDLVAARSVEFLGNALDANKPFFLGVAAIAPHSEGRPPFSTPVPAARHEKLFPGVVVPRTPNFNPDTPGAASYRARQPKLTADEVAYNDDFYRRRLQSLQAVDDMIDQIMGKLASRPDVLANTYFFYTSDNGFHISQHRLPPGKRGNLEEDVNVPFIARGPGIERGAIATFPTSHTDFVPTLFQLAGIAQHSDFDGVPMALRGKAGAKNEHVNLEYWGAGEVEGQIWGNRAGTLGGGTFKALRLVGRDYDFSYSVWCTGEHELYDMTSDRDQMHNLYGTNATASGFAVGTLTARLDALVLTLKNCKGASCRQPWKTLFPRGEVSSLGEAMDARYDGFFGGQERVSFSECLDGYILAAEGALGPTSYARCSSRKW